MIRDGLEAHSDDAARPQGPNGALPAAWIPGDGRRGMRLSTLIALRWRGLAGQVIVLGVAGPVLGLELPLAWCIALVSISAALNFVLISLERRKRQLQGWESAAVLGFDTVQLAALLFLNGGVLNPFAVLLVAPVALAAATLPTAFVAAEIAGAVACVVFLSFWSWPLPSNLDAFFEIPLPYKVAVSAALIAAIGFTGSYAWRASKEAEQMELALNLTQQVLAREQRLSALGALAAAAAHELGTPLATIQVVSRELARGAKDPEVQEDARLLIEQAERCREILKRLTEAPETPDAMHDRITLRQFLNEAVEPHQGGPIRVEAVVTGPAGAVAPEIRRLPEIFHAFSTLIDNATDFARSEVLVRARFDTSTIQIEVHDDGPGFSAEMLTKLGAPYVTSRPHGEGSRSGHLGMGLGFFIAKTLLEKTGASVSHHNDRRGGAVVTARWPRSALEAPAEREFLSGGA